MTAEANKSARSLPFGSAVRSAGAEERFVGSDSIADAADAPRLAAIARAEYASRRRRDAQFDADIFAEPAWDMLLDLYVQRYQGREVSIHSLCIAAAVPPTTALRWIGKLESLGFIDRRPCPHDARVIYATLSARGLAMMERYLRAQLGEIAAIAGPLVSLS